MLQQLERHRQMMILQHGLVVVHERQLGARVDQILIGEARVVDVVDGGREHRRQDLKIGEHGLEGTAVQENVDRLGDVGGVDLVVIGHHLIMVF